ncbi:class II histone deacetylase [Gordonia sp. SID5947]|uniref:class II histone deacetylase n=1 Tax=Gordonia sp. SID5947 TaxID=2690315 RepID=UPI00136C1A10|nr:class II histone deacetylase [Gordonia sp. SID5947]MYR07995.1 class II histone deacetylase [Gordonia sp. SID5947]
MTTGYIWHEIMFWHDTGRGAGSLPSGGWLQPGESSDSEEPKRRVHNLIMASEYIDELVEMRAPVASREALERVHTTAYLDRVEALSQTTGGDAGDGSTPFTVGGYDIARRAAGAAIAGTDAVLSGTVATAYALSRPPGHHAEPDAGMGYCIFNNIAIAVEHARAVRGVRRIAVIDWDVHHGNGTETIFYEDPDVLTISFHQEHSYPKGRGEASDRGCGAGEGYNVNIPLPPGSGTGAYEYAMAHLVDPLIRRFAPELIFVASGYDASAADPLGRMMLHSDGYRSLTTSVKSLATDTGAKLVVVHEGGYSSWYAPMCALAVIEALRGTRSVVTDPYLQGYAEAPGQALQDRQRAIVDAMAENLPEWARAE